MENFHLVFVHLDSMIRGSILKVLEVELENCDYGYWKIQLYHNKFEKPINLSYCDKRYHLETEHSHEIFTIGEFHKLVNTTFAFKTNTSSHTNQSEPVILSVSQLEGKQIMKYQVNHTAAVNHIQQANTKRELRKILRAEGYTGSHLKGGDVFQLNGWVATIIPAGGTFTEIRTDKIGRNYFIAKEIQRDEKWQTVKEYANMFYEIRIEISHYLSDDEIDNVSGCIGYACRQVIRGEDLSYPEIIIRENNLTVLEFQYDTTKTRSDDPDFWQWEELVNLYVNEGSPKRKTMKFTRLVEGIGKRSEGFKLFVC